MTRERTGKPHEGRMWRRENRLHPPLERQTAWEKAYGEPSGGTIIRSATLTRTGVVPEVFSNQDFNTLAQLGFGVILLRNIWRLP